MARLLVVDDEPSIQFTIRSVFEDEDIEVECAGNAEEAIEFVRQSPPDVVLLDIRLGSQSGLDLFSQLRDIDPRILIVFITGHGTTDTAIETMKLGAYDYLVKPLDLTQLQRVVHQAMGISRLMHAPALVEHGDAKVDEPDRLIGSGMAMQSICKQIGRIAPQDVNVLVLGESGTGKELVARAIYHHSRRSRTPFLAINCAAIPDSLLESELFGHERGAFTGANQRRIGKFEQSHGGTLFLDEIGDMAPHTQAKILRFLQEKRFERVGGNEAISVNVRIIAATNQDLDLSIDEGRFRKDLYYRLRGVTIRLPPLRERTEDISELAHYFLFRFNRQLGTMVQSIAPATLELLERYPWPGNIRELQSVVRESLIVSAGSTLLAEFLPAEIRQRAMAAAELPDAPIESVPEVDWASLKQIIESTLSRGETDLYRRARDHFDRLVILRALRAAGGHQQRAAEILGLSRMTLRAKLRGLGLSVEKVAGPKD